MSFQLVVYIGHFDDDKVYFSNLTEKETGLEK